MTLVLDAGGVSTLSRQRARLEALGARGEWPPQVPSVVLAEALTRDHPRDFPANRLLRTRQIRDVDELMARSAARLRTATGQPSRISAVDAVVAALADATPDSVVLTSDPGDLTARSGVSGRGFAVRAI